MATIPQLQSSLLLASLSLIPNNTLRYMAVGVVAGVGVLYAGHLGRPSVQVRYLQVAIKETEDIIQEAKQLCSLDLLGITEESVKLLEVKRSASMIQCRILNSRTLDWKTYRLLSRDLRQSTEKVKEIVIAVQPLSDLVQLIIEAEHQRKFTEDIKATQVVLDHFISPSMNLFYSNTAITKLHQLRCASISPDFLLRTILFPDEASLPSV
ncbi:hypothetical protein R3P38DRAFT_3538577 [Favolaschia claudopus]|uniref:Uncharacterized protein n=1 Tax=Favolaschia claudopus TaxID=2862362 RepID=A0AAW0B994_9AGAR